MKVKQIIEELSKYNQDAEVLVYKGNGYIEIIKKDTIEYNESTNELIFT